MGGHILIRTAPIAYHNTRHCHWLYGSGCPYVGIECLIEQVNKLIMHYGCPSNDGLLTRVWIRGLREVREASHRLLAKVSHGKVLQTWGTCQLWGHSSRIAAGGGPLVNESL